MDKKDQYTYFAGKALSGITSNSSYNLTPIETAELAHQYAQEMMKQMPDLIV